VVEELRGPGGDVYVPVMDGIEGAGIESDGHGRTSLKLMTPDRPSVIN